jgi:hypothetical protein
MHKELRITYCNDLASHRSDMHDVYLSEYSQQPRGHSKLEKLMRVEEG